MELSWLYPLWLNTKFFIDIAFFDGLQTHLYVLPVVHFVPTWTACCHSRGCNNPCVLFPHFHRLFVSKAWAKRPQQLIWKWCEFKLWPLESCKPIRGSQCGPHKPKIAQLRPGGCLSPCSFTYFKLHNLNPFFFFFFFWWSPTISSSQMNCISTRAN